MKHLVIGYGNTLRGDDGVGPRVAAQVATLAMVGVRSLSVQQLTPELAAELAAVDRVWFVDAWVGGSEARLTVLTANSAPPITDHGWTPAILLHLSQTLYGAQPLAAQLLIPAVQFDYGETLSAIAQAGLDWAVQRIQNVVHQDVVQESACHA